jgi:hypothetical protein
MMDFSRFIKLVAQYYYENKYYASIKYLVKRTGRIEEGASCFLVSEKPGEIGVNMAMYRAIGNPMTVKYKTPCYRVFQNKIILNKKDVTKNVRDPFIKKLYLELEGCAHNPSAFGALGRFSNRKEKPRS